MLLDITKLKPHPRNVETYGNESIDDIVASITKSKWIKPITVTQNNVIISGHRRYYACKFLGITEIPGEVRIFKDEFEELEALLLENANREKTKIQKDNEWDLWEEIEKAKAKQRRVEAARKTNEDLSQEQNIRDTPNLAEHLNKEKSIKTNKSESRNIIGEKVGLSHSDHDKIKKIKTVIKEKESEGKIEEAKILSEVLEKSTDGALKLIKENGIDKISQEDRDKIKSGEVSALEVLKNNKKKELLEAQKKKAEEDRIIKEKEAEKRKQELEQRRLQPRKCSHEIFDICPENTTCQYWENGCLYILMEKCAIKQEEKVKDYNGTCPCCNSQLKIMINDCYVKKDMIKITEVK